MRTRYKLEQTKFFWKKFRASQREPLKNQFFFSGFAESWDSVLDAMVIDMARHYQLSDELAKIIGGRCYPERFDQVFSKHSEGKKFYDWWIIKVGEKRDMETHKMRNRDQHTGYDAEIGEPIFPLSAPQPPTQENDDPLTFSLRRYGEYNRKKKEFDEAQKGFEEMIKEYNSLPRIGFIHEQCPKDIAWMEAVVAEAEREFNVDLN